MEAYYLKDSRIQEWVEQVIETILASCLLTGVDSDAEYQKGCEIVEKLTSQLQGLSMFPTEYLADGLKQILEQQLPDSRVINNFPTFRETMNKMLNEGMLKVLANEKADVISSFGQDISIPALASMNHQDVMAEMNMVCEILDVNGLKEFDEVEDIQDVKDVKEIERGEYRSAKLDNTLECEAGMNDHDNINQIPENAERLNHVLSTIFPNVPIIWNTTLQGERFLARVEDILIFRFDPAHPCQTEKFNKDGWKVMQCSEEDLNYPRRLERMIKHIMRMRANYTSEISNSCFFDKEVGIYYFNVELKNVKG